MSIDYENDLLKHFVRTDGWLPLCKRRKARLDKRKGGPRRLRYFTFCAVGAVDVLMLDVARVVRQATTTKKFDTVVYFDRDEEAVIETNKRIPGSIGFPGNFIEVVLDEDDDESTIAEDVDPLESPGEQLDQEHVRKRQNRQSQRRHFVKEFPFDVINLDLEEFLFTPKQSIPGKLVRALRKILEWQKRKPNKGENPVEAVSEFSLMFTTQIGPPDMGSDFLEMLRDNLKRNMEDDPNLVELLRNRAGTGDLTVLSGEQFELFFKLSMPKVIAATLLERDWYVDPAEGIRIYQFQRERSDGPYQMLHLIMDVRRQEPTSENRAPGIGHTATAMAAYRDVVRHVFANSEVMVVEETLDKAPLLESLGKIKARRRLYCPDDG